MCAERGPAPWVEEGSVLCLAEGKPAVSAAPTMVPILTTHFFFFFGSAMTPHGSLIMAPTAFGKWHFTGLGTVCI